MEWVEGRKEEDIIELLVQFVLRQLHEVLNPVALLEKEVLLKRSVYTVCE
jgi:hypothetical protein